MSDYLLTNSSSLTRSELSEIIAQADVDFEEITSAQLEDNNLDIPTERVPYVRAWLWREGFYCKSRKNKPYRFSPSSTKLSKSIYGNNTLRGHRGHKPLPEILYLGSKEPSCREYPGAPVSTVGGGMISRTFWNTFCKAIKALNLLFTREFSEENLPLPTQESINVFENISIDKLRDGRYKTLPSRIVFDSINNAIQFHIKYSEVLLSSLDLLMKVYSEKLKGNSHNHSEKIQELLNENEFRNCLDTKLKQIGVECWGLDHKRGETTGRRFEEMRKNKSFSHLLRIYYGGAYIVVCSLMARRASELNELSVKDCLDNTESFLIFRGAKTTRHLQGKRKLITRPIDEIAVEMINVLKDVQNIYLKHGLIDDLGNLFDAPSVQHGGSLLSVNNYPNSVRDSIDFFCDYFETPLNEMGQRYYIRPHQMRRFFALSFFWGSGFGGMETLRWFLGHADAQHLYHYITESSPGAVLVHAKAQFLTETIDEHKELGDLLSRKYGASDFSILESDELEDYIRELIECGDIELEPDFFEDDDKKQYELILTVRKVGRG